MSVRLRIDLAYHGGHYSGWAKQPQRPTVQGALEEALAVTLRLDRAQVTTVVAGRTDAGVHALGQVAHLDLPERYALSPSALQALPQRLQGALKTPTIVIHDVRIAPEGFDARFSPLARRYEYRIADAQATKNPLLAHQTLWRRESLDIEAMNRLGQALSGLHDWASFCKAREGATTIRDLQVFRWRRDEEGVLVGDVVADAFCHSMVRALVGAALAVGSGKLGVEQVVQLRDEALRTSAFPTLAAHALTLVEVVYPPDAELASRADQTRNRRDADPD